jgi:hypothetical protein
VFRELGPPFPPIKIQRWSWRRIGLTAWVGLVVIVLVLFSVTYLRAAGLLP